MKQYNFLHFEFTGNGNEADHLQPIQTNHTAEVHQKIAELNAQGMSLRNIAAETGLSVSQVHRVVKKLNPQTPTCW